MTNNIRYLYDLVVILTKKEIQIRYKSNVLGYLWSIGNPILFSLIYYFAFKIFMKVQVENYPLFLICALFPWQWASNSINNNLWAFLGNANIIKKTNFPKSVLPLSNILMECFHFLLAIPIILLSLYIANIDISLSIILYVPILTFIQLLLVYGISLFFGTLNLFFRDMQRFVELGMTMLFYATPIFYEPSMVPEKYQWVLDVNPFARLIMSWRDLFMHGRFDWDNVVYLFMLSIIWLIIGFYTYNKLKYRFAEVL